jgi:hypothetical protein
MGRKGRSGAPRHDDTGHHRPHLYGHGQAHQVGDVDLGAELLEVHGADEGQNCPDQEVDEADDG